MGLRQQSRRAHPESWATRKRKKEAQKRERELRERKRETRAITPPNLREGEGEEK